MSILILRYNKVDRRGANAHTARASTPYNLCACHSEPALFISFIQHSELCNCCQPTLCLKVSQNRKVCCCLGGCLMMMSHCYFAPEPQGYRNRKFTEPETGAAAPDNYLHNFV